MNPNYIQKEWELFVKSVGLTEAPDIQKREMRRAFFAGSFSLLRVMMGMMEDTGDPNEVTEIDLQVMTWVHEEFQQYQKDLAKGRA